MKIKILFICVVLGLSISSAKSLELSLDEAIILALENNSEVRISRLELEIRNSEVKRQVAQYIPEFTLDSSYTYSEDDPDSSNLYTNNQDYQAVISQKLPLGGELTLSAKNGKSDYSSYQMESTSYRLDSGFSVEPYTQTSTAASRDNYNSEINVFYRQHLLKDGIIGPAFAPIKESRFNHAIQKDFVAQSRINLIKQVEISFNQTVLRQKEIKIYHQVFEINKQLLNDLILKQQLGMIPEIDIMSARIKLNEANEMFLSSRIAFEETVQTLKTLLNIEEQITVITQFKPDRSLNNLDDLILIALNNNKEILQLKTSLEKESLLVSVAKNRFLPQVDLYLNMIRKDQGDSFGKSSDLEEVEYRAGLAFTYPFYPKDPEENYLQAKKRLKKVKVGIKETEVRITNQVSMLYKQIQLIKEKISIQTEQVQILRERMDLALKAFQERLIDLKIVYDIQDDRIEGEQKYLFYLFEYQRLRSSLNELTGQSIEHL